MPIMVSVGLSKKIGQPDFGSLGASCQVEFEVDGHLLQNDLDGFQRQVKDAYVACRQAVQAELSRHQHNAPDTVTNSHPSYSAETPASQNGHSTNGHSTNGQARSGQRSTRRATASQARALHAIASRQGIDLAATLRQRFGTDRPEDLSIAEASRLIDELNGTANGRSRTSSP